MRKPKRNSPSAASQEAQSTALLLRDKIYAEIKADILSCDLNPGSKLHEQALAEKYGVSKSPVRDALLRLENEGLVEVSPRKGYNVSSISMVDSLELYEFRQLLERACVERSVRAASDAELKSLDKFRKGPTAKGLQPWLRYNYDFHMTIAAICGNERLKRATQSVIQSFDRLTYASVLRQGRDLDTLVQEHALLIDVMQKRDEAQASQLIRDHITSSRNRFLDSFAPARLAD